MTFVLQVKVDLLRMLSTIATLKHLHLGKFELTEDALNKFWADSNRDLEELTLQGVPLSTGSLASLKLFTSLRALGISDCQQVGVVSA